MISGSVTEALNAKGNVTVTISPFSEAFGFASRTTTFVRVIDLDRSANREILRGRVSAITDSMDSNGKIQQEITCVSALDFLEDTGLATISDGALLQTWLSNVIAGHNGAVEANRQLTLSYTGSNEACIYGADSIAGNSRYNVISQILTSGSYLSTARSGQAVPGYTYEFRERYENDTSYIDVARKFSTDKDTAFVIGENLQSIRVEQTTDGGIYNAVVAVSGVNSDGSRESYTAYNAEMRAQYPGTYSLIVRNDSIRCTAAMYDDQRQWTEAHTAMWNALRYYAQHEASNLSTPPIKITLTAADLAAMGFSGYETFEVGGAYPLVFPKFGYHGQRVRITSLKRRLYDGKIEQIVIEQGVKPGNRTYGTSGTLSAMISQLDELNRRTDDAIAEQVEIMKTQVYTSTSEYVLRSMSLIDYQSLATKDDKTFYIVKDGDTNTLYIGDDHIDSGGQGGTIECAAILTSEYMTEWAPLHDLVPVWFRGNAAVYYGQPPAKIIIQGQRATFGGAALTKEDIMSEIKFNFRDGTSQTLRVYIHYMTWSGMRLGVMCYNTTGAAEVLVGSGVCSAWFDTSATAMQIGLVLYVSNLYANSNLELAPQYSVGVAVKIEGQNAQTGSLPGISGSKFDGDNVDFGSVAERGFASGIMRKTEPV